MNRDLAPRQQTPATEIATYHCAHSAPEPVVPLGIFHACLRPPDITVYVAGSRHPWPSAASQNPMALLRHYQAKSTDLSRRSPVELLDLATMLNTRARDVLGFYVKQFGPRSALSSP